MVSSDRSESRAASLTLVGGELALDFANTCSGRGFDSHCDHLRRPEHVALWAARAKILSPEDAEWLAREAAADGAHGLLDAALGLREDVYWLGAAIAAGRPAPLDRIENLTQTHARALSRARLAPIGDRFGWTWDPRV